MITLDTRIKLYIQGDDTDPDKHSKIVEVGGEFAELVKLVVEAMYVHPLMHSVIEAADDAFHDPKIKAMLEKHAKHQKIKIYADEKKKIVRH